MAAFVARARTWIVTDPARQVAVCAACLLVLLAGAAGVLPVPVATLGGVGVVALWATVLLVRLSLDIHHQQGDFTYCRGSGFVGMAALATGVTMAMQVLGPVEDRPASAAVGLVLSATLFVLGTLLLPGAATTVPVRLRRAFDGLGLGVSVGFVAWLTPPVGGVPTVVLIAALAAAGGIAVVTVTVLRAVSHRRAAMRCGAGAVLVLIGLYVEVALLAYRVTGPLRLLAAVPIVVGLVLATNGATMRQPTVPGVGEPREPEAQLACFPLLALPVGVGVIAAVYHLVTVGSFDRTSLTLGVIMVAVLTMREVLAVSDIRRYAGLLAAREAHFRSLVAAATDLTLVVDGRLTVTWQSPAAARLFGLSDSDVLGRPFADLVHPEDRGDFLEVLEAIIGGEQPPGAPALVNARVRDGFGVWRDTESTISDQRGVPEVAALVMHVRDVGERKHLERALQRVFYTDQLTGLANRRGLMRDVGERRLQPGRAGALLVIDLHGVAEINDTRGRETGDAVLIEVGRRIRALLGEHDVAARLGGDEFAVLTSDGAVLAYALGTRLVTALVEPYQLPGTVVLLHASVGLSEVSAQIGVDELVRQADMARRRARQLGQDRVEWYDPDVESQLYRRMDLEREINGADERGELDLVFQPMLALRDGRPVGVEALLRWRHPQFGTIMPAELIPVIHSVGIGTEIGDWVLEAACRRLVMWSELDPELWMSVNVAPRELLNPAFPAKVAAVLTTYGIAPERLVVEVAEAWVAEDVPAVVAALASLRRLGVRAALDDFGAGQASLAHLRRLPVDMLKLDRGLLSAADNGGGQAVIDVVVSLGRRLGLEIVAKGLETPEHVERVRKAGCPYGQGFQLARPAPPERIEAYLEDHRASSA